MKSTNVHNVAPVSLSATPRNIQRMRMIFGLESPGHGSQPETGHDPAVFPLALPSIASPGAIMAVIVLTDNNANTVAQQCATAVVLIAVLGATWLLMILSDPFLRLMGRTGAAVLVRVMGLILAALSVELVMAAIGAERWLAAPP